jgi:hypothetical protein
MDYKIVQKICLKEGRAQSKTYLGSTFEKERTGPEKCI